MTYTANIPFDGQTLGNSKSQVRGNFTNYFNLISVDHNAPNATNQGYHKVIHFSNQGGDPATIAGVGQVYTKTVTDAYGSGPQLFYRSGGGGVSQLTGSSATANGYAWCGGILIQWGSKTLLANGSATTITFNTTANCINFPNNIFNVQLTMSDTSNSPSENGVFVKAGTLTTSGFNVVNSSSSVVNVVYWMAIGN